MNNNVEHKDKEIKIDKIDDKHNENKIAAAKKSKLDKNSSDFKKCDKLIEGDLKSKNVDKKLEVKKETVLKTEELKKSDAVEKNTKLTNKKNINHMDLRPLLTNIKISDNIKKNAKEIKAKIEITQKKEGEKLINKNEHPKDASNSIMQENDLSTRRTKKRKNFFLEFFCAYQKTRNKQTGRNF